MSKILDNIADHSVIEGAETISDLPWVNVSMHLKSGARVIAKATDFNEKILLHIPMTVHVNNNASGGINIAIGRYDPFSDDMYSFIDHESIESMCLLSKRYLPMYNNACVGYLQSMGIITDKEAEELHTEEPDEFTELDVSPDVSEMLH